MNIKLKRTRLLLLIIILTLFLLCSCAKTTENSLYQVSTLQALIEGSYDGSITAKELTTYGDIGLGTFDGLDGEMIVLDGKVYKATVDGKVTIVPDDETIPFANVAYIRSNEENVLSFKGGYDILKQTLNDLYPEENMPILFCIEGEFKNIEFRSVPGQEKPYPPLTEVVKNQTVFKKESIKGTLIGFRFPSYMSDINTEGFHLHFISEDKLSGGHLLEVSEGQTSVKAQTLNEFNMFLPDTIKDVNLTQSDEEDVTTVESKQE